MPMPVQFHEPLSELQQRAEDLEYTDLLDQVRSPSRRSLPACAWTLLATSRTTYGCQIDMVVPRLAAAEGSQWGRHEA
jgi:hypothetical protein